MIVDLLDTFPDAQVNVNWGSKATQFHGSLGKAAATTASNSPVGSSPDDDSRVHISWRGDAAYFAVSTLDRYEDGECCGFDRHDGIDENIQL
jgi:elongator complex protein 1